MLSATNELSLYLNDKFHFNLTQYKLQTFFKLRTIFPIISINEIKKYEILKNMRYTNLCTIVMCKTFCDFKQAYSHTQGTSFFDGPKHIVPYKK